MSRSHSFAAHANTVTFDERVNDGVETHYSRVASFTLPEAVALVGSLQHAIGKAREADDALRIEERKRLQVEIERDRIALVAKERRLSDLQRAS